MFNLFNNKMIYYGLLFLFIALTGSYLFIIYAFPSVSNDSGYYLKIAYDLANGLSFFKELNCSYSPLVMYMLSVPFYFSDGIGLVFMFTYYFAVFPLIGVLFYQILKHYSSSKKMCLFFTTLLIAANFVFEGFHILLEPYVLLFQLTAIWILLTWKLKSSSLFLVGVLIFLAFYSKQYGLFIFPAVVFWIYKEANNTKRFFIKTSYLGFGFLVPILLAIGYFYTYENIAVVNFLARLFGIDALKGDEVITWVAYTTAGVFKKVGQFTIDFPFFALLLFFIFSKKNKITSQINGFSLLLVIGAFCTLYFAYYSHYFQLIIPYVILAMLSFGRNILEKKSMILVPLCLVFLVGASLKYKNKFVEKREHHHEQLVNIPVLKSNVISKDVYLHGISPAYYFLCKYNSPSYAVLGYKYPVSLTLNTIASEISKGGCILIEPKFFKPELFNAYSKINEFKVMDGSNSKTIFLLEKN
ncbi:hypothetical protein C1H87_21050 [Flavivirga eckloniae]|uniref:Glycosyltransferase RgtA/B/C/D-like domain-containing protein n=2 Tax=Flavivirga eckloniae TaxID=1803846 RepID=A0A2K9PX02_9FLAO|nr:hypothetical protein C1H87_21050 [Flavivirga eckloniae]